MNAPNWIGILVEINGETLDLASCKVSDFKRELNVKEGWYHRSFTALLNNGIEIDVNVRRFLSLDIDELGVIKYEITPKNNDATIVFKPYLDAGVHNEDANWEEKFWEPLQTQHDINEAFVVARTFKTHFEVATYMHNSIFLNNENQNAEPVFTDTTSDKVIFTYEQLVSKGQTITLQKFGGYTVSMNHASADLIPAAQKVIQKGLTLGYDSLLQNQIDAWAKIWEMSDITIEGDVKAQQGIRFNIFQLNQTYLGKDSRLNIGPKGFTGEKYGGSTYWDTEAYCIPFYMATKGQQLS